MMTIRRLRRARDARHPSHCRHPSHAQRAQRVARATALLAAGALALTGCAGASTEASDASSGADVGGEWPRTVSVNGEEVELMAAPERIVALSTETGDLGLELIGPERFAAVANGSVSAGTGNQLESAEQVPTAMPPGTDPDPEMILSLEPDLVLMTGRHSGENDVAGMLAESGVPTVSFGSGDFSTPDDVIATLGELGELLGAEDAAEQISSSIEGQVAEATALVAGASDAPRTLVLFARGGQPMLMGAGSSTTSLVELAGGTSIASEQQWNQSIAADPEAVVAAAPEVILVQDFQGKGLEPFAELLESPALAAVPAVANGRVYEVDATTTSGTAGSRIGEGLSTIAELLHP